MAGLRGSSRCREQARAALLAAALLSGAPAPAQQLIDERDVGPALLYPDGPPPGALRLPLQFAVLEGSGWTGEELVPAAAQALHVLVQCRVVAELRLVWLRVPPQQLDFRTAESRELARRLPLPRPTVYFVRDTRRPVPFDAEAIGRSNSRGQPELSDTIWVARGARDLPLVLAHELVHLLSDSGEHVDEPGNLMNEDTRPGADRLNETQCRRLRERGLDNGLLRQPADRSR